MSPTETKHGFLKNVGMATHVPGFSANAKDLTTLFDKKNIACD
jgi:hypothetical protein